MGIFGGGGVLRRLFVWTSRVGGPWLKGLLRKLVLGFRVSGRCLSKDG